MREVTVKSEALNPVTGRLPSVGEMCRRLSRRKDGLESVSPQERLPDVRFAQLPDHAPAPLVMREPEFAARAMEIVLGADDRTHVTPTNSYPTRCICSLRIVARDGSVWRGTGWLAGPRLVVTAGHVVFIAERDGWVREIEVVPAADGPSTPYGRITSQRFRTIEGWAYDADEGFDYGAILLPPAAAVGTQAGFIGYASLNDEDLTGLFTSVTGYPVDKPDNTLWQHGRELSSVSPRRLTYSVDTAGGQSGSPVWTHHERGVYAVGIHTSGDIVGNGAVRITDEVFDNISRWNAEVS